MMKYFIRNCMRKIGFVHASEIEVLTEQFLERVSNLNSFMRFMGEKANLGKITAINDDSRFQYDEFIGDVFVLGDRNQFINVLVHGHMHFSPESKMNALVCSRFKKED